MTKTELRAIEARASSELTKYVIDCCGCVHYETEAPLTLDAPACSAEGECLREPVPLRVVVEVVAGNVVRILANAPGVQVGVYDHDDLAAGVSGFGGFSEAKVNPMAVQNIELHDSPDGATAAPSPHA